MITVATYPNPTDAYIAKGLLESCGIHCEIRHEHVQQLLPIGAVELLVVEQDATRAREILTNGGPS